MKGSFYLNCIFLRLQNQDFKIIKVLIFTKRKTQCLLIFIDLVIEIESNKYFPQFLKLIVMVKIENLFWWLLFNTHWVKKRLTVYIVERKFTYNQILKKG